MIESWLANISIHDEADYEADYEDDYEADYEDSDSDQMEIAPPRFLKTWPAKKLSPSTTETPRRYNYSQDSHDSEGSGPQCPPLYCRKLF